MKRIFFSAGEASGDAYAAAILAATESIGADWAQVQAIGGPLVRSAGAELVADSSRWGALGILESLKTVPSATRGYRDAVRELERSEPGLFVPIDFGFFNIKLARRAKRAGWRVLYFAPPSSWRRDKQGADLPAVTDVIVTPFPWSAEILTRMGADARFLGHPLLDLVDQQARAAGGAAIAVLPGSRLHEVKANFTVAREAARRMDRPVIVGLAPTLQPSALGPMEPDVTVVRSAREALAQCAAAVVCSGTATLEAALIGRPQVVIYRGSRIMELESRIRKPRFDFISLPNIVLQRAAVPELIQHAASETAIASHLKDLLTDGPARARQLEAFDEVRRELQPPGCIRETAKLCLAQVLD